MSKEVREEKKEVSLDLLLARLNELREYINILQGQVNALTQELGELQLALASIKGLEEVAEERKALIAVDRLATIFVPAKISGLWRSSLLVNIGRNYYVKTDSSTAEKIVSKRIGSLQKILQARQQELARAVNEYNYIQQLIASALQQLRREQR